MNEELLTPEILRLPPVLARRLARRKADLHELQSAGYLALVFALRRYDPSRGASFSTVAYRWVFGAILRARGRIKKSMRRFDPDMALRHPGPDERLQRRDDVIAAKKILNVLTPENRRIFIWSEVLGLNCREIARRVDFCGYSAVCKRLEVARELVRREARKYLSSIE